MTNIQVNLLIDKGDFLQMLSDFRKNLMKNIKTLFVQLLEIDYYYYILKILQSLPEAFIIIFLGSFAVFNLFKFNESSYGNKIYPITSSSMTPQIKPGSLIYTSPSLTYQKGDIISYVEKSKNGVETGKVLTHRIIGQKGEEFIAKGDANKDPDPVKIDAKQIQGKVLLILPHVGYLDVLTRTIPGFLVLIATPSIFLLFRYIKEIMER